MDAFHILTVDPEYAAITKGFEFLHIGFDTQLWPGALDLDIQG